MVFHDSDIQTFAQMTSTSAFTLHRKTVTATELWSHQELHFCQPSPAPPPCTFGAEALINGWGAMFEGACRTGFTTPALCKGWPACDDTAGTPLQTDKEMKLVPSLRMIILKAVLVWNNKADGIWGALLCICTSCDRLVYSLAYFKSVSYLQFEIYTQFPSPLFLCFSL